MLQVQNFWKILERQRFSEFAKSATVTIQTLQAPAFQSDLNNKAIPKDSPAPNTLPRRSLRSEVTQRLPSWPTELQRPRRTTWDTEDHTGHTEPRRTRQEHEEHCVWPLAPTQSGEDPPHRLPRLSRPLLPVWGQQPLVHRGRPHLPAWRQPLTHHSAADKLTPTLPTGKPTHREQTGQLPTF